jgi:hypothetical protein
MQFWLKLHKKMDTLNKEPNVFFQSIDIKMKYLKMPQILCYTHIPNFVVLLI